MRTTSRTQEIRHSYIEASHLRCAACGIQADQVYSRRFVAGEELYRRVHRNQQFIRVAEPFLNDLYGFVKGSDFFVVLTDAEGCILNMFGDEAILSEAFSYKMIPGAFMDEPSIGTNAMGTAIAEGAPVQVSGNDHFIRAYHRWTCSAAPIRDPEGSLLGVLDLTGYSPNVHPHTLGMVVAAANAIERMIENGAMMEAVTLEKIYSETIIDSITAGIVAVGTDGGVSRANRHAGGMFGYTPDEMRRMKAFELFDGWEHVLDMARVRTSLQEDEVTVHTRRNKLRFTLSSYPITGPGGDLRGIVLVFKELRRIRKLASRIMGQKAIYTFEKIVGENPRFRQLVEYAKRIADSRSTILITGESGTGKELFAQAIHNHSPRREEAFVAIHCGALPLTQIEDELFGLRGTDGQPGKVALADGGTLFLDEIDEMPPEMQSLLLRVIEEGTLARPDGRVDRVVDVRIIASSSRDLEASVREGRLRKDLYYRLNVLPLQLPPLRERRDDIPLLLHHFLKRCSKRLNKRIVQPTEEEMKVICACAWAGNIRELENFAALIINTESVPLNRLAERNGADEDLRRACFAAPVGLTLEEVERRYIRQVLDANDGNVAATARALRISRNTLYRSIGGQEVSCGTAGDAMPAE